MDAKRF